MHISEVDLRTQLVLHMPVVGRRETTVVDIWPADAYIPASRVRKYLDWAGGLSKLEAPVHERRYVMSYFHDDDNRFPQDCHHRGDKHYMVWESSRIVRYAEGIWGQEDIHAPQLSVIFIPGRGIMPMGDEIKETNYGPAKSKKQEEKRMSIPQQTEDITSGRVGLVGIHFESQTNDNFYVYKCARNQNVSVNDMVVVEGSSEGNYRVGRVIRSRIQLSECTTAVTKMVIGVVDDTQYKEFLRREQRAAELTKQMEKLYKSQGRLDRYRQMAENNEEMAKLLDEFNSI